jgi:hypothetical protein
MTARRVGLLMAQGIVCLEAAGLLGDAPCLVEHRVRRFEAEGLAGLWEGERPAPLDRDW